MLPFLELAHMVDATSSVGFGVGWGCYRSLNLHTWSMLRLLWGLGWGGDVTVPSFLEFAHMVVATSSKGFGVGWGCYRSLNLHTCSLMRSLARKKMVAVYRDEVVSRVFETQNFHVV